MVAIRFVSCNECLVLNLYYFYNKPSMIKTLALALVALSLSFRSFALEGKASEEPCLLSYVNILQGTDNNSGFSHGNTLPLVGMPWGMTDWAIQSEAKGFFKPNAKVAGFRATHEPSPWMGDYGQFLIMPQSGDLAMDPQMRVSSYDTARSVLRPDYEKLELVKDAITAEITATERCAAFRFTFHRGSTGRLIVNAYGGSEIQIHGRVIRGLSRINKGGVTKNFASYFVIEMDRDIAKSETFVKGASAATSAPGGNPAPPDAKGQDVAAYVEFNASPEPVELKVGTSFISWEQAEQNLRAETKGGFEAAHERARSTWENNLGRIDIDASPEQKKTFYSCLYRAQMFPHRLYEADASGKALHYSPYDGKVHEGVLYGDIGIWDAFRTTFPLITILYPSQLQEILQGFVNASNEGGTLPEWPNPGYRSCMIGQHCAAIFADAVIKGLTNFDVKAAYTSLRRSAFEPPKAGELVRSGMRDYLKNGYIPDGSTQYALSATLDYAYDDWCVAQIARQQGEPDVYKTLMERAQNYRKLWDPGVGFMRPRNKLNGAWVEPFDEFAWGGSYAESGPWQSSWFVPHDPAGLAELMGGKEKLASKLDAMLATPPTFHVGGYHHVIHEMREMAAAHFGQYAQSNQPSFNNLYLFTAAGKPWETEYWTRRVCSEMYDSSPDGFSGDEDNGSMASWYLLSSIGLYSLCPGTSAYLFTSPLFTKVTLRLPGSKTFTVSAAANDDKNVYVQERSLNGVKVSRTWIDYSQIMNGGSLAVTMGPKALQRIVRDEELPYSVTAYK